LLILNFSAEHFALAWGTLMFRGTVVGKHCHRTREGGKGLNAKMYSFEILNENLKSSSQNIL
jgi:hypothetical protein